MYKQPTFYEKNFQILQHPTGRRGKRDKGRRTSFATDMEKGIGNHMVSKKVGERLGNEKRLDGTEFRLSPEKRSPSNSVTNE